MTESVMNLDPNTVMPEKTQKAALLIGAFIRRQLQAFPELEPLFSAWRNYARKRGLSIRPRKKVVAVVVDRDEYERLQAQIKKQAEEIAALDFRIKTLLER
jgi:hypothetical protein